MVIILRGSIKSKGKVALIYQRPNVTLGDRAEAATF